MPLRYAYNSNGLQSHRLLDALDLLADSGYQGIALTLDHMHLDPLHSSPQDWLRVKAWLRERDLAVSVETGARYVLDARRKHRPTWLDADAEGRARRSHFISRCLEIAEALEAESVVLFSGTNADALPEDQVWDQFLGHLEAAAEQARRRGFDLSLEPEPGHLVATMADWQRCQRAVAGLKMTLDVGHVPVTEPERDIAVTIEEFAPVLGAVHMEDSRGEVHEHLPFGEGCLDHQAILASLKKIDFQGLVAVELSRHSHAAHTLVPASIEFLRALER